MAHLWGGEEVLFLGQVYRGLCCPLWKAGPWAYEFKKEVKTNFNVQIFTIQ